MSQPKPMQSSIPSTRPKGWIKLHEFQQRVSDEAVQEENRIDQESMRRAEENNQGMLPKSWGKKGKW